MKTEYEYDEELAEATQYCIDHNFPELYGSYRQVKVANRQRMIAHRKNSEIPGFVIGLETIRSAAWWRDNSNKTHHKKIWRELTQEEASAEEAYYAAEWELQKDSILANDEIRFQAEVMQLNRFEALKTKYSHLLDKTRLDKQSFYSMIFSYIDSLSIEQKVKFRLVRGLNTVAAMDIFGVDSRTAISGVWRNANLSYYQKAEILDDLEMFKQYNLMDVSYIDFIETYSSLYELSR